MEIMSAKSLQLLLTSAKSCCRQVLPISELETLSEGIEKNALYFLTFIY